MCDVKTPHFNFLRISQSTTVEYDGGQTHGIEIPSFLFTNANVLLFVVHLMTQKIAQSIWH
jgi:hypothetical protein